MKLITLRLEEFCQKYGFEFRNNIPYHCGVPMEGDEKVMKCGRCRTMIVDKSMINRLNEIEDENQPSWVRVG